MSKPEAENSPNPPSGSDFYQILDQLMLAAESNNLQAENEIFNQISDWHSSDIQKFTQLTNQVLNDLDSNYNLIKSKFDQSKLEILEKNGIGAGKSGYNTEKINNGQKENSTNFSDYEFCLEQLKAENLQLEKEEKELILKLENLQKSVSRKQKELIEYEKNIAKNDIMEDQLTNDYFDYKVDYMDSIKKRTSIDFRSRYIRALATKLSNVNVFKIVFQITENVNTMSIAINGFKLSGAFSTSVKENEHDVLHQRRGQRRPREGMYDNLTGAVTGPQNQTSDRKSNSRNNYPVARTNSDVSPDKIDWQETNCAWGQVVLLLNGLINKFSVTKPDVHVVAMGPWSYVEKGSGNETEKYPLYHSANNWISLLKRNDSKYIDACIMVVDYFEFICQEIDIQQEIEKHRSHKITKWSSIRKNFSEKKYPQAGYGLLKNLNVILCSEKLN